MMLLHAGGASPPCDMLDTCAACQNVMRSCTPSPGSHLKNLDLNQTSARGARAAWAQSRCTPLRCDAFRLNERRMLETAWRFKM